MSKTHEEIKKGLAMCSADECHGQHTDCPYHPELMCIRNICADAIAMIQQLEAQVPKWISVNEQAEPGEDGEYVCCGYWFGSGRKQVETAVYSGEWDIVNNFVLTHWMPLPELPKEEATDGQTSD